MMHFFFLFTTILWLQDEAISDAAGDRSEVRIKLTMLGLGSSISVPEEIADPQAYVDNLRRQEGVQWSEQFVLSTMENEKAMFHRGNRQAVALGAMVIPGGGFGDRTRGRPGPVPPLSNVTPPSNTVPGRPDATRTAPASGFGRSVPTVTMEETGTAVSLTPGIDRQGRLFVDANIESSRLDDARDAIDAEDQVARWCIRKLEVKATVFAVRGKPVLLRVAETDVRGILPDQTVLILVDARIVP